MSTDFCLENEDKTRVKRERVYNDHSYNTTINNRRRTIFRKFSLFIMGADGMSIVILRLFCV